MRSSVGVALLLIACVSRSFASSSKRGQVDDAATSNVIDLAERSVVIPNRYIVEFKPSHKSKRDQIVRSFQDSDDYKILKLFDSDDLFFGASVEVKDDDSTLRAFRAHRAVARAWPARRFRLDTSLPVTNYSEITDAVDYQVHNMTGVDKLHKEGILGEGATIAVIDTGVNYLHSALGGGIGPDHTVIGGTDLVGDGCFPEDGCAREPDDDPMDYDGHGTHVAGIIAGKNKWFTGVAPKAKILAYKVFSQKLWVTDDVLIESFLVAYEDGADIITASLGTLSGWENTPWAVVADRVVNQGVIVTLSAGNDGNYGPFLLSDGAAGQNVLAVAAVEPDLRPEPALFVNFTGRDNTTRTSRVAHHGTLSPLPSIVQRWPIVDVDSACELPKDLDLTNKLPLVANTACTAGVKDDNLVGAGAQFALLYSPEDTPADGGPGGTWRSIAPTSLSDKDGQAMAAALAHGYKLTATSPEDVAFVGVPNPFAGTPSYFTTLGSTWELGLKPDIGAPGSQILSLFLNQDYAIMSGTSMATPYVAGVAALYISKYGKRSRHGPDFAMRLNSRILASGKSVSWADYSGFVHNSGLRASVTQVGTGLINASTVLDSTTQLSFTKFTLNDTERFTGDHTIEVTNESEEDVLYTFELEGAGGYEAFGYNDGEPSAHLRNYIAEHPLEIIPEVYLPRGSQHIKPGETRKFRVSFDVPEGMNNTNMPLYSGKVLIKGSNGDELSVPYFGAGGNTGKEVPNSVWFRASNYPKLYSHDKVSFYEQASFTFDLAVDQQDFPKLEASVAMGAPEMRWDIFERNWTESLWRYPPVPGQYGFVGSVASWAGASAAFDAVFDPERDDINDIVAFPIEKVTRRVSVDYWWLGTFTDGTSVKPGKYKMRLAALTVFGDPKNSEDWDVFDVPMFTVLPKDKRCRKKRGTNKTSQSKPGGN